ncbi:MAG: peptide chain release factor N(5)-glutamine methyltransferase [Anaerolineae bacterium]
MPTSIRHALNAARARIQPVSDSAGYDAQVLLGRVLGVDRVYLLAHPTDELTDEQQEQFDEWVERCATGEPLAYIIGQRAFYDRDLFVSTAVLVPRPETELLLEMALKFAHSHYGCTAVDVGTGSGALAVIFAAHQPASTVYATDVSPDALEVAQYNAETQHASVTFYRGDLLAPLLERGLQVDLIMANLPYIPSRVVDELPVTRHEPRLALDGGADGLDLVRRLLQQAQQVILSGGLMLLEIGYDQGAAAAALAQSHFPTGGPCDRH